VCDKDLDQIGSSAAAELEGGCEDKKSADGSIAARPGAFAATADVGEADSVEASEGIDREGAD
jgi:hypothetical protein